MPSHAEPTRGTAPPTGRYTDRHSSRTTDPALATGGLPYRAEMESAFGHDFSGVSVLLGQGDALRDRGASAIASADQVVFADASPDRRMVAHELAHVVQQQRFGAPPAGRSEPGDASEREAHAAADAVAAGLPARIHTPATGRIQGNWFADATDSRENEAEWDAWEDYQDARTAMAEFLAGDHWAMDFQSASGRGMFDVHYDGSTLWVFIRATFRFENGSAADYPDASAADLTWTQEAQDSWKSRWMSLVNSTWSGNHTFWCQEDWWESLSATVRVLVFESDLDPHYDLHVVKIPTGAFRQSAVTTARPGGTFGVGRRTGTGDFDSEDMEWADKPGGRQLGAVHEAGHMLGLADEYGTGTPAHSAMVQTELGHGVTRGADSRIMSGGMDVQPEHGVTFLAALREATDKRWAFTPKDPRDVPPNPATLNWGDYPMPDPNGPRSA